MSSGPGGRNLLWELVGTREDRNYPLFGVRINWNRSPRTGQVHEFQVLTSPDWVAVIPLTQENQVVMVRQYRHGTGQLSLEPPGGLVKAGQSAEQSGREELEEETGYVAEQFEPLGSMRPFPALFTNHFHVFLARNATPTGRAKPEETEDLETVLVPADRVKEYIRTGKINGSVMIAALHLFIDRMERDGLKL